jgi:proteic killer suppression protein
MIKGFKNKNTENLFNRQRVKAFEEILLKGRLKLRTIDFAAELNDLAKTPGNRLEALGGNRKGQHSIGINKKWRICFVWAADNNAYDVGINKHYE